MELPIALCGVARHLAAIAYRIPVTNNTVYIWEFTAQLIVSIEIIITLCYVHQAALSKSSSIVVYLFRLLLTIQGTCVLEEEGN